MAHLHIAFRPYPTIPGVMPPPIVDESMTINSDAFERVSTIEAPVDGIVTVSSTTDVWVSVGHDPEALSDPSQLVFDGVPYIQAVTKGQRVAVYLVE